MADHQNIGDVTAPKWQRLYVEFWPDTRSELAVPIVVRKAEVREGTEVRRGLKPIGVMNIESSRPDAFSQTSADLIWSLAQHAATVIEKLEFDERLSKLEEIERGMGQLDSYEETARTVAEAVKSPLGYDYVNLSFVRPEAGTIKTEYVLGVPPDREEEFKRLAEHALDGPDMQADIVRSGVAEVPPQEDPRFDRKIYGPFGHKSLVRVYVPMRLPQGNRVIGTIEAGYNQTYRRFIYERDVNMLQGFADYSALALEHKKLASFNLYLAAVLKEGLAKVGATQGSILMLSTDNQTLEVIESHGRPYAPGQVCIEVGRGIAGVAVRDRRAQRVADIRKSEDFIQAAGGEPTFRSMLVVPLVHRDRCIGAICANGETVGKFTQDDENKLVEIAQRLAGTIDQLSVDAFIGHTRRLNQLERFRGMSEEWTRFVRDLPGLCKQIANAAVSLLEADSVVLYDYDEDTEGFAAPPTFGGDIREPDAMGGRIQRDDKDRRDANAMLFAQERP